MKKVLITAYDLNIGGIEKSLINLLKRLNNNYEITLLLENKQGSLIDLVPPNVTLEEYKVSDSKNILFRKISNFLKFRKWKRDNSNKYDFSICYATYSIPGKKVVLAASKNNAIWIHSNYQLIYKTKEKCIEFFELMELKKFSNCVFVSKDAYNSTIEMYPEIKEKSVVCNNYIDLFEIKSKSKEEIDFIRGEETLFINVGRHEENSKRLTRIIEACKLLKEDNLEFKLIMIGDGPDHDRYVELVNEYQLNDKIIFLGSKKNPFPYYKISDCVVLSSDYEGYPVVFLESLAMHKPIISTKVSDYKDIENYGVFVNKNSNDIYLAMKRYIEGNYKFKTNYDIENLNKKIDNTIKKIIM